MGLRIGFIFGFAIATLIGTTPSFGGGGNGERWKHDREAFSIGPRFGGGGFFNWQTSWNEFQVSGGNAFDSDFDVEGGKLMYGLNFVLPVQLCCGRPFVQWNFNQAVGDNEESTPVSGQPGFTGLGFGTIEYDWSTNLVFGMEYDVPLGRDDDHKALTVAPYFGVGWSRMTFRNIIDETQFSFPLFIREEEETDTMWVGGLDLSYPLCRCGRVETRLFTGFAYYGGGDSVTLTQSGANNNVNTVKFDNDDAIHAHVGLEFRWRPFVKLDARF